MRQTITLSLPGWLRKRLEAVTREEDVSRSDIVRTALQQYFATREFRKLRGKGLREAEQLGYFTDEEIFRKIS